MNFQQGIIQKDLSISKMVLKVARIVTSLLHANYKGNLMTRFSTNKQEKTTKKIDSFNATGSKTSVSKLSIKKITRGHAKVYLRQTFEA